MSRSHIEEFNYNSFNYKDYIVQLQRNITSALSLRPLSCWISGNGCICLLKLGQLACTCITEVTEVIVTYFIYRRWQQSQNTLACVCQGLYISKCVRVVFFNKTQFSPSSVRGTEEQLKAGNVD